MMKPILTIFSLANFPSGWEKSMHYFHALSVRADCLPAYTRAMDKAGEGGSGELHGWAWIRARTVAEAREEGKKHALLCSSYGLKRWYANAEAEWAGVEKYPRTLTPYNALRAYALAWRIYSPADCQLAYNGFSWGRTSDGRKLHDAALLGAFDVWCPMVYGNNRSIIEKTFWLKVGKYTGIVPILCPMLGVGRRDAAGDVWGFWDTHEELLARHGIQEFCWFFGNGAKKQLLEGHRDHPALVTLAREAAE